MTRFARAKGSKSSNERKPEEATSWAEMRRSLLSKKTVEPEKHIPECIAKPVKEQKCNEWASLGDDNYPSESLLKQHLIKKNKKGNKLETTEEKKKGKKKKMAVDVANEIAGISMNGKSEKKIKKQKISVSEGSKDSVKEKKKKRKKVEDDSEEVAPKKKKKLDMKCAKSLEKNKGKVDIADDKKLQNKKTKTKSKPFKNGKEIKGNYSQGGTRQFQGKFSEQPKGKSKFQNKNFEKGSSAVEELIINGEKIEIVKFQGFYVTLEDAERLKKLRSEMKKEGIPRDKMEAAIKLERRRAEKSLSRLKKSVCFHCRGHGHLLSNCPNLLEKESTGTGICYKCGSTEHSATECKVVKGSNYQFAECFICKEQGHIARQCPDNPRGLYPQGGACRECGDVTHLRKDCPHLLSKKEEEVVTAALRNDRNLECLDEEIANREKKQNANKTIKKNSTVKF